MKHFDVFYRSTLSCLLTPTAFTDKDPLFYKSIQQTFDSDCLEFCNFSLHVFCWGFLWPYQIRDAIFIVTFWHFVCACRIVHACFEQNVIRYSLLFLQGKCNIEVAVLLWLILQYKKDPLFAKIILLKMNNNPMSSWVSLLSPKCVNHIPDLFV